MLLNRVPATSAHYKTLQLQTSSSILSESGSSNIHTMLRYFTALNNISRVDCHTTRSWTLLGNVTDQYSHLVYQHNAQHNKSVKVWTQLVIEVATE